MVCKGITLTFLETVTENITVSHCLYVDGEAHCIAGVVPSSGKDPCQECRWVQMCKILQ